MGGAIYAQTPFQAGNPTSALALVAEAIGPVHGPQRRATAIVGIRVFVNICIVRRYLRTSISGRARTHIMTATRPPGGSVFLVEDEVMIRMMVADMLEELGYSVAAEAGEINEAMRLAQSAVFDLAILDVNVNGKVISPVADLIRARNLPFIFATGYGSSGLPEEYRDRPALQKPFQLESLSRMIDTALKNATV
jgi:CheY-like chemotaxis protein